MCVQFRAEQPRPDRPRCHNDNNENNYESKNTKTNQSTLETFETSKYFETLKYCLLSQTVNITFLFIPLHSSVCLSFFLQPRLFSLSFSLLVPHLPTVNHLARLLGCTSQRTSTSLPCWRAFLARDIVTSKAFWDFAPLFLGVTSFKNARFFLVFSWQMSGF